MNTTYSHSPRSLRRALIALAIAGGLATGSVVTAAPADAYSSLVSGGTTGHVVVPAVTANGSVSVYVPGITVYRNGAAAWGQGQPVTVQAFLELHTARGWETVDMLTQNLTITNTADAVTSQAYNMTPRYNYAAQTGYYRVTYNVVWRGPWVAVGVSPVTGYNAIVPNQLSENRCGISACTAGAGWLYIRR